MSQKRRMFLKEAAVTGGAVACGVSLNLTRSIAENPNAEQIERRCPYFDQPLTCDGPDVDGKYRCDVEG